MRKLFTSNTLVVIFALVLVALSGKSTKAYSKDDYHDVNPDGIVPVTYFWKIVSNKKTETANGGWPNGPS